jgi:uncharacterized protein YwbE
MNDSRIKKIIQGAVLRILTEADPQPPANSIKSGEKKKTGKVTQGPVGRGGIRNSVREAAARASTPEGSAKLMKELKVKVSGTSIVEKVLSVIKSTISGIDVMQESYSSAEFIKDEATGDEIIRVSMKSLDARTGAFYIRHILTAAHNSDLLGEYNKEVEVGVGDSGVVIKFK